MWSKKKQPIIIVSGPSGAGKSSLVRAVLDFYGPKKIGTTISYTTRPLRNMEEQASDYHFVSEEEFLALREKNFFVEWAKVYHHYYGGSREQIEEHWRAGRAIIKDLDVQGSDSIKKIYPQALRVFVTSPSKEELVKRVLKRQASIPKDMDMRLEQAQKEMEQASEFDHQLKNVNFDKTFTELKKLIEDYLKTV